MLILIAGSRVLLAASPRTGKQVFDTYCASCHGTGWQGAPIAGIREDWQPRLTGGAEALFKRAKDGVNAMPPMGTCMDCTDAELRTAIDEMLKF
jgi:cytochrome c5